MKRFLSVVSILAAAAGMLQASPPPSVTPRTVVCKVESFEHYRALGGIDRFSMASPYGNEETIIATIVYPVSLAGREIAIPFESKKDRKELLVQRGTVFRFEHRMNLADLRNRTEWVHRRAIEFPALGLIALKPDGEAGEIYAGVLTPLVAAAQARRADARH
jgi:hypothetical protein